MGPGDSLTLIAQSNDVDRQCDTLSLSVCMHVICDRGSPFGYLFMLGAMIGAVAGFGTSLGDVCTCVRLGVVVHIVGVVCSGAEITCDGDRTN